MALKERPQPRHALEAPLGPAKRRGHMSFGRKILLSVMTLGTIGTTIGAGTFASFTAQTANTNSTFQTGTLILGDKVGAGTMCFSSTAPNVTSANANGSCGAAFSFSEQKPGMTSAVNFNIQNAGTIAGTLQLIRGACGTASNVVNGEGNNGTADPCTTGVYVTLQEYSDDARTSATTCWYGSGSPVSGTCSADTSKTISTLSTAGLPLNGSPGAASMAAGATRYFKLTLSLPSSVTPNLQGRQNSFDLTWKLTQA